MLKVLHCIPGMGGGGAERQLAYLAAPLTACGWEVHVALLAGGPNLARLEAGGGVIHRLTAAGNHDPRLAWRLARVRSRIRPHLVQVWFVQMDVIGGLVAELSGTPWIMSERSCAAAYPSSVKNRMRVLIGRTADAIIANSAAGAGYWASRAPAVPRFVVPNAVPLDEIDGATAVVPPGILMNAADRLVLFAGRFGAEKNVETLVRALRDVVARPGIVAALCGDGPLRNDIRRAIAEANLSDRILTPGYVSNLWPLMKRASVFVSIGLFEGHPNAVLEAMACGTPLVLSDIPAHRDIVDAGAAFWVDPLDPAAIALALNQALDDPATANARASAARSGVSRLSIREAAAEYDRVYRGVLARRSAARGAA